MFAASSLFKFNVCLKHDEMLKFSKIYLILSVFVSAYPAFCSCVGLGFGSDVVISYVDVVRSSNTSSDCLVKDGGLLSVVSALRLRRGTLSRGWKFRAIGFNWLLLSSRWLPWPHR